MAITRVFGRSVTPNSLYRQSKFLKKVYCRFSVEIII